MNDQIILKKEKESLENMLEQISKDNLHKKISVTSVMGNEVW